MNKRFTLVIRFIDTNEIVKYPFEYKVLAIEWFNKFIQTNKRPVVIVLYNSVSPCWVYRK